MFILIIKALLTYIPTGTFYTQKTHFYHVLGYNYTAICELVPGHNAGGCRIVYKQIWNGTFYNSNSTELIQAGSNTVAYGNLNFSDPGVYSVEVYDLGNSNDEPAIRTSLVIDQSTRGLPTVIITSEFISITITHLNTSLNYFI